MVPIQDDPVPKGQSPELVATHESRVDLVRIVVQVSLVVYLLPVLLVVCLIGGISVLAGVVAKFATQLLGNPRQPGENRPPVALARAEFREIGARGRVDRNRSRVSR